MSIFDSLAARELSVSNICVRNERFMLYVKFKRQCYATE